MARLVVARPNLIARQALIVSHMCPLPNLAEVSTCVFAVAVKIIHALALKVLRRERRQITLAHDLLANMIDTMSCRRRDGQ